MTRHLRANKGRIGLILANGGVATYQAAICLSRSPRRDGLPYPRFSPLPAVITDVQVPPVDEVAEGDAVVEVSFHLPRRRELDTEGCWVIDIYCGIQPRRDAFPRLHRWQAEDQWPSLPCEPCRRGHLERTL